MSCAPNAIARLFDDVDLQGVLADTFYRDPLGAERLGMDPVAADDAPSKPRLAALGPSGERKKPKRQKADHYEILCISMYVEDLARLDAKVAALKGRGHRRMTRSALIRYALDRLALDDVPKPGI